MDGRKKLTPWQKIMRAGQKGTGVRLTAEDCHQLSLDDAIETRAQLDNEAATNSTRQTPAPDSHHTG